jgi:hypothetical protein
MFKIGDWVTTEYNGGIGEVIDTDMNNASFHVRWVDEPRGVWHTDGRVIPLAMAETKLWRYLREE